MNRQHAWKAWRNTVRNFIRRCSYALAGCLIMAAALVGPGAGISTARAASVPVPSLEISSDHHNVFSSDKPVQYHVSLSDKSGQGGSYNLNYQVTDGLGKIVVTGKIPVMVPAGGTTTQDVTMNITKKGYYHVKVDATGKNSSNVLKKISFNMAVVDPWNTVPNENSPIAINGPGAFLNSRYNQSQVDARFAMMEREGMKYSRSEIRWDRVEPIPGNYTWKNMDGVVKAAHDHGIHLLGLLDYWGNYADPFGSQPKMDFQTAVQNYVQYVQAVVARYKPGGTFAKEQGWTDGYGITAWEIWNEPSTKQFWPGTVTQYGQLVKAAGPAIKKIAPKATMLAYSYGGSDDQEVMDTAGKAAYNGISPHFYPGPENPDTANFYKEIQARRQFLTENGVPNDQIWITETGWDTYGGVTERQQAEYEVRADLATYAAGADKTFLFTFDWGSEPPGWGNVHPDLTPKPVFPAVAALSHRITGYRPAGALSMGSDIRAYSFTNGNDSMVAVWSVQDKGTLTLATGSQKVDAYDMMDNLIGTSSNGRLTVPLSGAPVYLVAKSPASVLISAVQNGEIDGISPLSISVGKLSDLPWKLPSIKVTLQNQTNKVEKGQLSVSLPEGWAVSNPNVSFGPIKPGEQQVIPLHLTHVKVSPDNQYPVTVKAINQDGQTEKQTQVLSALASLQLTPEIDGNLNDWKGAVPIYLHSQNQVVGLTNWTPSDLSAVAYTAWDNKYFYFAAKVTDQKFYQPYTGGNIWQGDSIQLYFDPLNDKTQGRSPDDQDFGVALTPNGPEVWAWNGQVRGKVYGAKAMITHGKNGDLTYEVAIPLSTMSDLKPVSGHRFGFDMLINDNNGSGRAGWMWLTPGVGNAWDASQFPTFTMVKDATPPVTTATVSPMKPDGQKGWYIHPVTVSLSATDDLSGVTKTESSIDGGQTWNVYASPLTFDKSGKYTLLYRSVDNSGNVEASKTLNLNVDAVPPTIHVTTPIAGSYNDADDLTPDFMVSDNLSGVDAAKTVATLDGQAVQKGEKIPLYKLALGTHVFTVSVQDLAGNSSTRSVTFRTKTSIGSLKALVKQFVKSGEIDNAGIANGLEKKLSSGNLKSFIHEVQAQTGKHIAGTAAKYLIRDAQALNS